jgi:hypothetical protein
LASSGEPASSEFNFGSLRFDLGAGKGLLNAFDHDPVTRIETGFDDHELALLLSGFDDFARNDIVRADHQHIAALLARPDRVVSRQQRLVLMPDRSPDAHEKARQQRVVLVVEDTRAPPRYRSRGRLRRDVVEMSFVRIAFLILQPDLDRDARKVCQDPPY